jgi:hypothetical protein
MATCAACGSTILFGGKTDANGRFCNQKCQARGSLLATANRIPEATVKEQVWQIHQGLCPKCKGAGPIDVHTTYKVWSLLLLTSWKSVPELSCRSCGRKRQLIGLASSAGLGWWGFPWGFIMTPIQIVRNVTALTRSADASAPSPPLEKIVRMKLASQMGPQQLSAKAIAAPAK